MEHYLTPLVASLLFVQLIYGYVAPAISGGRVSINPIGLGGKALFTIGMSISFSLAYAALAVGIVVGLVPFLKEWAKFADEGMIYSMSIPIRLLIAQTVFFILSIGAGKIFKNSARVESRIDAWKVAWIPAIIVVLADVIVGYFVDSYFAAH